jgi:biopolymer transport protein ExbB/TolQ
MNPTDQSKKFGKERFFVALAPFIGLGGTTFGIIRAFERLDKASPNTIPAAILDTILGALILNAVALVWDWLSKK